MQYRLFLHLEGTAAQPLHTQPRQNRTTSSPFPPPRLPGADLPRSSWRPWEGNGLGSGEPA